MVLTLIAVAGLFTGLAHQFPGSPFFAAVQIPLRLIQAIQGVKVNQQCWTLLANRSLEIFQVLSQHQSSDPNFAQHIHRLGSFYQKIHDYYQNDVEKLKTFDKILKGQAIRRRLEDFSNELDSTYQSVMLALAIGTSNKLDRIDLAGAIRQDEAREAQMFQSINELLEQNNTSLLGEFGIMLDRQHEYQIRAITVALQSALSEATLDQIIGKAINPLLQNLQRCSQASKSVQPESWRIPAEAVTDWSSTPIAHGGFGQVYTATYYGSPVAVKQLLTNHSEDEIKQFRNEINVWHKLNHPNVLPLLGACDTTEKPFMVSPFMKNGTLRSYVSSPHEIRPLDEKLKLMYQVASGMAYLHEINVVHGDLKSDNVFIDSGYHAVLADFGMAYTKRASVSTRILDKGQAPSGTFELMAPEMLGLDGKDPVGSNRRTDVYAYGMTLYEVLNNGKVWMTIDGQLMSEHVIQIQLRQHKRPKRTDDLPDNIWNLIELCWSQDPYKRPKFTEIVTLLQSYRDYSAPPAVTQTGSLRPSLRPSLQQELASAAVASPVALPAPSPFLSFPQVRMPVPETQAVPSASPMMLAQSPMISIDSHDSAPQDRRSIPAQRHASLLPGQGGLSVEFPGLDRKRSMTLPTIHVDMSRQHSEVDRTSIQDVPRLLQVKADNGDAEAALEVAQIIATDMPVDSPRWDQAARYFQKSADALNIEACFEVAWLHFVGLGLHKSDLDGFNYWKEVVRRSADPALRHMSLYMLGWCSFLGRGAPSNRAVATECFRSSAQDGFVLGEQALDFMWNQDVDKMQTTSAVAKRFFERCALLSPRDPLLAHLTAACLLYGFGTARDQSHALQILEQQSDQGFHPSQALLGCCYFYGFGVNRDHRTAAHWFARAAEHDNPYAQVNLALCYEKAYGVPQNFSQSTVLYKQAAVQGSAEGQRNLGHSYFYGRGTARDHAKAVEWYRRSADQGNVEACDDLGQCFKNGLGVQQNYAKAIELFSKAAKGGNVASLYHIGLCYYYGHGVGQSYELAAQFLQNAAEKGDNNAQNSLAICYTNGRGIPVDLVKAVEWFRKAAEGGNPDAMLWMGINYSRGHGVMQDNNEAKRWLLRAADKGNAKARELYSDLIQKEIMASDGRGARQNPPRAAQHNNNRVAQGSGGRNEGNPFARQPTVSETLPRLHP